jgi:bifunctional diaminopimelate decarboxylase / aspartate kinase
VTATKPWVVMKFGGTSVADPANWPTIRDAVEACLEEGTRPFVACSALSGISNLLERLLAAADEDDDVAPLIEELRERHVDFVAELDLDVGPLIEQHCRGLADLLASMRGLPEVPPAVRAEVMSVGEMLSTSIGAQWLSEQGLDVVWKDARELLCAEPPLDGASDHQRYLSAVCDFAPDAELRRKLPDAPETVVVTQGFIARNEEGRTVLLGRGGSDTAAAYFAAKLHARRLEIWTDVPGVFTANPQQVRGARLLQTLSYDEAETLAGMGAKVLHPRCIQPVREAGLPLHIRWTAKPHVKGTVVTTLSSGRKSGVKAVSSRENLCLISMEKRAGWQPVGFMADVAACFKRHALSIDLLSSSPWTIQATVDLSAASGVSEQIPALTADLDQVCDPTADFNVASVSLVGHGMRSSLHRLGPMLELLRERKLLMLTQAGNDLTFSFVVPRGQTDALLELLHKELFGDAEQESPFGPTWEMLNKEKAEMPLTILAADFDEDANDTDVGDTEAAAVGD